MCRLGVVSTLLVVWLSICPALGAEYKLTNGDIFAGQAASFNDDGLIVRLDLGGFSPRVPWGKLTQETLKELMDVPEAREFVEPYIEVPIEVIQAQRQKQREIRITEPEKVPHSESRIGFFAAMANPLGFALFGALYLANLYAAAQIARFKGRPVALVVGVSAVLPVIGPILFALLPSLGQAAVEAPVEAAPAPETNPMQQNLPAGMQASTLGLAGGGAQAGKAAANPAYAQVYNRTNSTFDRRFFETKFTGFFRVSPAEPEKDLVIVVKTPKQEIMAARVSRISANEVHFQLQRGAEASVAFGEITEVSVRPKGAK
ncbi:MAG: hypothetical protein ACXW32_02400 [Limisphaerales bacterium]